MNQVTSTQKVIKQANNPRRLLSIETSGVACSVALSLEQEILTEHTHRVSHIHDRMLATMIERLMSDHGLKWDEIDAVAVSAGPGSFTGLRIGVSMAKALCIQNQPKLVGVPTLQALLEHVISDLLVDPPHRLIAAYPSQRGQLYAQVFDSRESGFEPPFLVSTDDFSKLFDSETLVCTTVEIPETTLHSKKIIIPLRADFLVPLALRMLDRGEHTDSDRFVPMYVQDFTPKIR